MADTDDNPFAGAKARRKGAGAGGQPQHTIKYYLWQVLQEAGEAGMTADELVQQLESRSLRSFAGSKKASTTVSCACVWIAAVQWCCAPDTTVSVSACLLQVQVELSRAKEHFRMDSTTRQWSLKR